MDEDRLFSDYEIEMDRIMREEEDLSDLSPLEVSKDDYSDMFTSFDI